MLLVNTSLEKILFAPLKVLSVVKHLAVLLKKTFIVENHFVTLIEVTSATFLDFYNYVIQFFIDNNVIYITNTLIMLL